MWWAVVLLLDVLSREAAPEPQLSRVSLLRLPRFSDSPPPLPRLHVRLPSPAPPCPPPPPFPGSMSASLRSPAPSLTSRRRFPPPIVPFPAESLDPSAGGGLQWSRPRRRPPSLDPGRGPAGKGWGGEWSAKTTQGPACLPAPRLTRLLQYGRTALDHAVREGSDAAAALLRADPRVAAALAAAGKSRGRSRRSLGRG